MNSARVAGGAAPAPLHSSWPEPQSPVRQDPEVDPSKLQEVLPQKRPDQPVGARKEREVSLGSSKPVVPRVGLPALARMPGQTVKSHLLTKVNVAAREVGSKKRSVKMREMKCGAEEAMEMKQMGECGSCLWIFGKERKMEQGFLAGEIMRGDRVEVKDKNVCRNQREEEREKKQSMRKKKKKKSIMMVIMEKGWGLICILFSFSSFHY